MPKKNRLIPFKLMPASWGLKGQAYQEAELAYYYDGEDYERKLIDVRHVPGSVEHQRAMLDFQLRSGAIDTTEYDLKELKLSPKYKRDPMALEQATLEVKLEHNLISEYEYDRELVLLRRKIEVTDTSEEYDLLEIELKHRKISEYDYDKRCAEIENEGNEQRLALALLDVEYKHHKITDHEYKKQQATFLEKPWIGIVNEGFDPDKGLGGVYFEFDWNSYWIEYLQLNGYSGITEEHIVEQWFADVCRSQGSNVSYQHFEDVIPFASRAVNYPTQD